MSEEKKPQKKAAKEKRIDHLTAGELHDFFQLPLSGSRESKIEAHLAECPKCAKLALQTKALLRIIDDWSNGNANGETSSRRKDQRARPTPRRR